MVTKLVLSGCPAATWYCTAGHRTAVGVEDVAHRGRSDAQQQLAQLYGRLMGQPSEHDVCSDAQQQLAQLYGRLMGQSSEHDVGHAVQLPADGFVEHRMVVTVYGAPP